jgi:hypothetical protein
MTKWSQNHVVVIGSLKIQNFGLIAGIGLNGDRAGPLGERGDSWSGRSGSGTWKTGTSKVVAPACVG